MFKGDALHCLLSLIHQIFIEHLLCTRSLVVQWRYNVELRELIGGIDKVTCNFKICEECLNRDTYKIYSTQKREKTLYEKSGKVHWSGYLCLVFGKMERNLPRGQKSGRIFLASLHKVKVHGTFR